MKNILITGGTGYIGKRLVSQLHQKGFELIVLTSQSNKHKNKDKITYYKFNILKDSPSNLKKLIKKVDTVIHLAWYVNPKDYLYSKKNFYFFLFSCRLAELSKKMKIKNFFAFGTCFEYDFCNKNFNTNSNLKPKTLYSYYKILTYKNLYYKFLNSGVQFTWFRLFYFYGGNDEKKGRLIPDIKKHIELKKKFFVKNPNIQKNFLHIEKGATKIFKYLLSKKKKDIINIKSNKPIAIRTLINKVFDNQELKYIFFNKQ